MKLLFDQNISARIVRLLQEAYPQCTQVSLTGLYDSADTSIWLFAKANNYCIATFDSDFLDLATLRGWPPKVILFRTGNRRTRELADILIGKRAVIENFFSNTELACLEIYG